MLCEKMAALGLSGDGGLAEYCRAPAAMCRKVPEALPIEHAALAEPLITDRIPLDDLLPRGLHRLEAQAADTLKILVQPRG